MVNVKNVTQHTTNDGFVTTTVLMGVVDDEVNHNGVYALRVIDSAAAPYSYESMKSCVAAAMTAMRGQYEYTSTVYSCRAYQPCLPCTAVRRYGMRYGRLVLLSTGEAY